MIIIRLFTFVVAPPERVFDLARSIEAHLHSASGTKERAVAGVNSGLLKLADEVTWEARHFGVKQQLTVRITSMERPFRFEDVMLSGAFKRMKHYHEFIDTSLGTNAFANLPPGTLMVDRFEFESPWGILGRMVDRLFLCHYMRRFLLRRNQALKQLAESDDWRKYIGN